MTDNNVICIGSNAGASSGGVDKVAIGTNAGSNSAGDSVVAVGRNAGVSNGGTSNLFLGDSAGQLNGGNYVVAIGYNAGYGNAGNNAIFIGNNSNNYSYNGANAFIVYGTGINTPLMRGDTVTNQLAIATTTLSGKFAVGGDAHIFGTLVSTSNKTAGDMRVLGTATIDALVVPNNISAGSLNVTTNTSTGTLYVSGLATVSSQIVQNNVGIGTTTPSGLLHLQKGPYNYRGPSTDGDSVGINFGSSNYSIPQTSIRCVDRTSAGGAYGGSITFNTVENPNVGIFERMRIQSDGKVGIGTTTPGTALDVNGEATVRQNAYLSQNLYLTSNLYAAKNIFVDSPYTHIRTNAGNTYGYIWSRYPDGGDAMNLATNYYIDAANNRQVPNPGFGTANLQIGPGTFYFTVANTNTAPATNALYINSTGYVGLGTLSPSYKLTVDGNTYVTSNSYIAGSLGIGTTNPIGRLDVRGNARLIGSLEIDGLRITPKDTFAWHYLRVGAAAQAGTFQNPGSAGKTDGTYLLWDTAVFQSTPALNVGGTDFERSHWTCPITGYYEISFCLRLTGVAAIGFNEVIEYNLEGVDRGGNIQPVKHMKYLSAGTSVNIGQLSGSATTVYTGFWQIRLIYTS